MFGFVVSFFFQLHNISKTLTSAETPPKEKYVRSILLNSQITWEKVQFAAMLAAL